MKAGKRDPKIYQVMRHEMAILKNATEEQQRRVFENATVERLLALDADFETWAHENQLPPNGEGWRTWLMMAGRGFGKTRAGAEWIFRLASGRPKVRIALVGATMGDARSVMVEGVSGLLSVARRYRRWLNWEPSLGRIRWPNGSEAQLFSGDSPDGLRGPEHDFAWFLTFEVIADAGPVEVCSILADASADAIGSTVDATVGGYAAYGASIASALQPLIDCFGVPLFDDGSVLRAPIDAGSLKISDDELGNSADAKAVSRITREQLPARGVPSTLRLSYYDAERDYQTGEARASAGGQDRNEAREELAAVLAAGDAKMLAQQMLARQWASRDRLTLRLPPSRLGLEPGSLLQTGLAPASWIIEKSTLEGFVSIVELRPAWQTTDTVPADAGRIVANMDVVAGPTVLALIDAPKLEPVTSEPTLLIAASSASQGWRSRPVTLTCSGERLETRTSAKKSVLGRTASVLGEAPSSEIDETNTVDIELIDAEQWLTSCDRDALATGRNLAVVGSEILQFAIATPLGQGRFRLESLLRGRGGTEWATSAHVSGELFCLLDLASLRPQPVPRWMRGANVSAADAHGGTASIVLSAGSSGVIASPSGGAVADSEARTAIDAILNALREQGLIEG